MYPRGAHRLRGLANKRVEPWPVLLAKLGQPVPWTLRKYGEIHLRRVEQVQDQEHDEPNALPGIENANRHKQRDDAENENAYDDTFQKEKRKLEPVEARMRTERAFRILPAFPFPARDVV